MKHLVLLPVFIPLITAVILLLFRQIHLQQPLALLGSTGTFLAAVLLGWRVWQYGIQTYWFGNWPPPFGIIFAVDSLGVLMAVLADLIFLLALIYAFYMDDVELVYFLPFFFFLQTGINGIFLTGDIFNFYVFFEVMVISSYILVGFERKLLKLEAAFKFSAMNIFASAFFVMSVAGIYAGTGTLNLADLSVKIKQLGPTPLLLSSTTLLLTVFMLKSALFPFHFWLPDAHAMAPTPISAVLSGVIVKVGVYGILRLTTLFFPGYQPWRNLLLVLGFLSIIYGGFAALTQRDIKRLLAYSTISQVGFLALAASWGTISALTAVLFYIIAHALTKAFLFLTSGAIIQEVGRRDIKQMGGLLDRLPHLAFFYFLGAISLSGIPPLSGFVAKFGLLGAAVEAGRLGLAMVVAAAGILTLIYLTRAWQGIFWGTPKTQENQAAGPAHPKTKGPTGGELSPETSEKRRRLPWRFRYAVSPEATAPIQYLSLVTLALLVIMTGILAEPLLQLAGIIARELLNPEAYTRAVLGGS